MQLEHLYQKIVDDRESNDDYVTCAETSGLEVKEVINKISLLFAARFINNEISYEDADAAMNAVWTTMLNYIMENDTKIIEPCYSVYCAFDEGEYDHRDDSDPVEKYTKPALMEILKNA